MNDLAVGSEVYGVLASRWTRLWAAMIDAVLIAMVTGPLMYYLGVFETPRGEKPPIEVMVTIALSGWVLFFAFNGYLLKQYGQTVGKRLLGIYIVTNSGEKPDFWPLIVRRYVVLGLLGYIPLIGRFISMVDVLFIFRKDKRCVHDLMAATFVVKRANAQPKNGPACDDTGL